MKRRRKLKGLLCAPWPSVVAWCPEANRKEALIQAVFALVGENGQCSTSELGSIEDDDVYGPVEAAAYADRNFAKYRFHQVSVESQVRSGRVLRLAALSYMDAAPRHVDPAFYLGFWGEPFEEGFLLPETLTRLRTHLRPPMEINAGIAWTIALWDSYDLLTRFCSASPSILTGACVEGPEWGAPVTGAGTYHADANPARDLALSWMVLHNKEPIDQAAGWPLEQLRERVQASPEGSSVWIIDEDRLSRDEVLKALGTPREDLVKALEASANERHPRWKEIEWKLYEWIETIGKAKPEEHEMIPVTEEHIHFIEEYSPAFVKHLDNGAVVLAAHPDRTLWPLWSGALRQLGIRQ